MCCPHVYMYTPRMQCTQGSERLSGNLEMGGDSWDSFHMGAGLPVAQPSRQPCFLYLSYVFVCACAHPGLWGWSSDIQACQQELRPIKSPYQPKNLFSISHKIIYYQRKVPPVTLFKVNSNKIRCGLCLFVLCPLQNIKEFLRISRSKNSG